VVTYPATFTLIAATNPCPCGFKEDKQKSCSCSARQIREHDSVLSGPLLDRIDIQLVLDRVSRSQLMAVEEGESSGSVRERVEKARLMQIERYGSSMKTNANVQKRELITYLDLESPARSTLGKAIDTYFLSGRGMTRVLRVARTIADIEGSGPVRERHIERALQLRLCAAEEGEDR
jgi:magnesium chelatase family protein